MVQKNKLLVLKNNAEVWSKKSQWELPGGIVETNEEIEEGLVREAKEETGLNITVGKILTTWDHWEYGFKLKDKRVLDIRFIEIAFFCQKTGGEIKLSDEHSRFKWATREEFKKLDFAPNSKPAIKRYLKLN